MSTNSAAQEISRIYHWSVQILTRFYDEDITSGTALSDAVFRDMRVTKQNKSFTKIAANSDSHIWKFVLIGQETLLKKMR